MREILFRGKSLTDGDWIVGGYSHNTVLNRGFIVNVGVDNVSPIAWTIEVDPNTVGQWTGYTDMNGRKIFEGDIVRTRKDGTRTEKLKGYFGVDSEGYPQRVPGYTGTTEYHYNTIVDCYAEVKYGWRGFYLEGTTRFVNAICNEVVGNIHDNPELLKGEEK